jgi:hypothetical protein
LAVYKFIGSLEGTPRVRARRFVAAFLLRITNSNCFGADGAAPTGYEKPQSGLRPLCGFSPPHFLCAGIATQFLHRAQKTSVALLLCEIERLEFLWSK